MEGPELDHRFGRRGADRAGGVEVEIVLLDVRQLHPAGVAGLWLPLLIGRVDEQHVLVLFAALEHNDAERDAEGCVLRHHHGRSPRGAGRSPSRLRR